MELSCTITVPKLGEFLLGNASRAHNRCSKGATREELERHHKQRIPGHFTRSAHGRYGYAARQVRYRIRKQRKYGSSIDLVATGASKRRITGSAQTVVSGQGDTVRGRLLMRFDWEAKVAEQQAEKRHNPRYAAAIRPRKKPEITTEIMKSEVRRTTSDERREIGAGVVKRYVRLVKTTTGSRQQVKV